MGPWTYYAPFWLGSILVGVAGYSHLDQYPQFEPWLRWTLFVVGCLLAGVQFQLVMIGTQGIFAQVLPAPGGRSIRGRGAAIGGALLILWFVAGAVGGVLKSKDLETAPLILGGIALAGLIGALMTYIWCWPIAARDFDKQRI